MKLFDTTHDAAKEKREKKIFPPVNDIIFRQSFEHYAISPYLPGFKRSVLLSSNSKKTS